jgi:ribosomal protein S18 acetylase RimI-like enzyme
MERSIAELQATSERFLGAFVRGQLAGAVSTSQDGEVEICSLAVHPNFQRLGLGRTMLQSVLTEAGGLPVLVSTAAANFPALALYRSAGFVQFKQSFVSSPSVEIVHMHRLSSNPSVKGTSTSGLRPLAAAPYLER